MNKSTRQLSKFFRFILHIIAFVFAYFLLQGGSLIIHQLPKITVNMTVADYLDVDAIKFLDEKESTLRYALDVDAMQEKALIAKRNAQQKRYQLTKEKYQAVLDSRSVTEDMTENDRVVVVRTDLDRQRAVLQTLKSLLSEQKIKTVNNQNQLERLRIEKKQLHSKATAQRDSEYKSNELKAFAIRLAFLLPLLALAVFLVMKYRASAYWPFIYGFGYFSIYGFFVELVPYFPSYGGYVRSAMGILLCVVVGVFTLKKLNAYLKEKQLLELEDEKARRLKLQTKEEDIEMAINKIMKKQLCPSCDRALIHKDGQFCSFCGLCLLKKCQKCGVLQLSFNAYCQSCGIKQQKPSSG